MIDKLIDFSLHNRLLIVMFAVMVIFAGYRAYTQLPIDAFPDVSPNLVQIFTETEGLAPEEIEMYVTYPVEVAMTGLPSIDNIRSVSNFGLSVVNVYFEDNVDRDSVLDYGNHDNNYIMRWRYPGDPDSGNARKVPPGNDNFLILEELP